MTRGPCTPMASDRPDALVSGLNDQKKSFFSRFGNKKKSRSKKQSMMYSANGLRHSRTSLNSESNLRINQVGTKSPSKKGGRSSRSRSRGGRHAFSACTGGQRSRSCTPERNATTSCTLPVNLTPDLLNLNLKAVPNLDVTDPWFSRNVDGHTDLKHVDIPADRIIPVIADHSGYVRKGSLLPKSESIYSQEKQVSSDPKDSSKESDQHYSFFSIKRFSLRKKSSKAKQNDYITGKELKEKQRSPPPNEVSLDQRKNSPEPPGTFRKRSQSVGRKSCHRDSPEPEYLNTNRPRRSESPPPLPAVRRVNSLKGDYNYNKMQGRPLPPLPPNPSEAQRTRTYSRVSRSVTPSRAVSTYPPQSEVTLVRTLILDKIVKNKWISGLAVTKKHEYVIVDLKEAVVVDEFGCLKRTFGAKGAVKLNEPLDLTVLNNGNIAFSDHADQDVKVYNCKGQYLRRIKDKTLTNIAGVTSNQKREIIIAGTDQRHLSVHSEDGDLISTLPSDKDTRQNIFEHPYTVAHNPLTGDIIVGDDYKQLVTALSADGQRIMWRFSPSGGRDRHFFPSSICVDSDGYIFIADLYNEKVYMLDSSGKFLKTLLSRGNGLRGGPGAICTDGQGHLLVADEERTLKVFKYGENGFSMYRRTSYGPDNYR